MGKVIWELSIKDFKNIDSEIRSYELTDKSLIALTGESKSLYHLTENIKSIISLKDKNEMAMRLGNEVINNPKIKPYRNITIPDDDEEYNDYDPEMEYEYDNMGSMIHGND